MVDEEPKRPEPSEEAMVWFDLHYQPFEELRDCAGWRMFGGEPFAYKTACGDIWLTRELQELRKQNTASLDEWRDLASTIEEWRAVTKKLEGAVAVRVARMKAAK